MAPLNTKLIFLMSFGSYNISDMLTILIVLAIFSIFCQFWQQTKAIFIQWLGNNLYFFKKFAQNYSLPNTIESQSTSPRHPYPHPITIQPPPNHPSHPVSTPLLPPTSFRTRKYICLGDSVHSITHLARSIIIHGYPLYRALLPEGNKLKWGSQGQLVDDN